MLKHAVQFVTELSAIWVKALQIDCNSQVLLELVPSLFLSDGICYNFH
jgi:hypothetical protein